MEKWKCTVCGYIHEGPMPEDFICPVCKKPASVFVRECGKKQVCICKGSVTEKNLWEALSGESRARNLYTYYADRMDQAGYRQYGQIFRETAENEKAHAKLWAEALGLVGEPEENLQTSIHNEHGEWIQMYARMARQAEEEGFCALAEKFRQVGEVEKEHEQRFRKLLQNLQAREVFRKNEVVVWQCSNCGHIVVGKEAPSVCPVCSHPQSYFQKKEDNY